MSKAYDCVEWNFLERVSMKLGFPCNLVNLIMKCVTLVSFSVLVNGNSIESFLPSRGIRQGDPLSLYLFLLCTEALIVLLKKAEMERTMKGIKICRGAPSINHMLFANDSIVFCNADVAMSINIQALLRKYELASGQMINKQKTAMTFSSNVPTNMRESIMAMWGGSMVQQYEKYLGLPPIVGKAKSVAFAEIKNRLAHNASYTWKGIWEARNMLQKGCQWRIGNGAKARIWQDIWVPGHYSLLSEESGNVERDLSARVVSLINEETHWWDVLRVRALFNPKVSSDILKILLSPGQHEDVWMWRHEKNGVFSVRSGYRFFKDLSKQEATESSTAILD
ncbi:uncharacterized protein LOC122304803 [Carya illinoinensis]|uniref:uncharacterized protein LOC122304803 n=1 Tax=Carya illinoinensis TaxID=32201 RepID=UPI001C71F3D7|nr:uncharacterized protein LOC122304803 [Carya illinoinensis]